MNKSHLLGAVCACLISVGAVAGLVEQDLSAPGDGLITLDTDTNLEWLDLTATLGQSYNSVAAGVYVNTHGFRFATRTDTGTLFVNAGFSATSGTGLQQQDIDAYNLLISLMGCTSTNCSDPNQPIFGSGIIDLEPFDPGWAGSSEYSKNLDGSGNVVWADQSPGISQKTNTNTQRGSYLVRNASAPAPEITVTDEVPPVDDLDIDFGNITEMDLFQWLVTVTNDGNADLTIGNIAVADALAPPFTIELDNCSGQSLSPAANCIIVVQFLPPATGFFNDSFDVPSDDADEPSVTVTMSGTGVAMSVADITVTDSVAPIDDLQIPFGNVTQATSLDKTVTIANDGNADLTVGNIAALDVLAAPFSILNDTCSSQTIVPAANCTLTVRFEPTATGPFNNSFDIPSDDADEASITVNVSGTGTATPSPSLTVTDSVAPADDLQAPFGNVTQATSSDATVTITNNGNANLTIGPVAAGNVLIPPFSILNDACSSQILAVSANCTLTVRFEPTATGPFNDSFEITSDGGTVTVNVSGTGTSAVAVNSGDDDNVFGCSMNQNPKQARFDPVPVLMILIAFIYIGTRRRNARNS